MRQRDEWPDAIRNSERKNHRGIDPFDESAFDPCELFFTTEKLPPAKSFSLHAMHEQDMFCSERDFEGDRK
jgi:hypothetical protein